MGENVSEIEHETAENPTDEECSFADIKYELKIQYRLLRKKWSAFIRRQMKKNFANILYITVEEPPTDFIISLQKQYPDKVIKVLMPIYTVTKEDEKTSISYFLQNKKRMATIYKIPSEKGHIQVYGIYTKAFSKMKNFSDIYDIKYLSHFVKIARKAALKIKSDTIYSDNVPFLMGLEAGNRWGAGYPIKYIQAVHDYTMYPNYEPFWAFINLANKKEMKRLCKDKFVRNNIALLFNLDTSKKFNKLRACFNYLYKHYDEYRQNVSIGENTKENVLLGRLNERVKKMFPNFVQKEIGAYNPVYYSFKRAEERVFNSMPNKPNEWLKTLGEYTFLPKKSEHRKQYKIRHTFDKTNFREVRNLNKTYLVRELSEKRIETKFVDMKLFEDEEVNISGYLDSFYKAPLFILTLNEFAKEQDIKTASAAILKAFELRKNIQVIYNYPKDFKSSYLKALFEFFASQSAFHGRWVAIEGKINLGQFMASSDMVLLPTGNCLNIEDSLYTALEYGCVPVVLNYGICGNIVTDILDDMTIGCGFKNSVSVGDDIKDYESAFIKALDFYTNNISSWNIILKNAMNYDTGWDFEAIEAYNNAFENMI